MEVSGEKSDNFKDHFLPVVHFVGFHGDVFGMSSPLEYPWLFSLTRGLHFYDPAGRHHNVPQQNDVHVQRLYHHSQVPPVTSLLLLRKGLLHLKAVHHIFGEYGELTVILTRENNLLYSLTLCPNFVFFGLLKWMLCKEILSIFCVTLTICSSLVLNDSGNVMYFGPTK